MPPSEAIISAVTGPFLRDTMKALLGGLATAVLAGGVLVAGARWWIPAVTGPVGEGGWTLRSRAAFLTYGFYAAEFDAATERSFSWTGASALLTFPNLERSRAHRLSIEVRANRFPELPRPIVRLAVEGGPRTEFRAADQRQTITVEIPPSTRNGVAVTLDVSDTFVPGPHDRRPLGVVVDLVGLAPDGRGFGVRGSVLARLVLAVAAAVAGIWLCGLRWRVAVPVALAIGAAFPALLLFDGAFIGQYVFRLANIGIGVGALGLAVGVVRRRWPAILGLPEWSVAVGLLLGATVLKLAVFGHPHSIVGDAIFQVRRAEMVHVGRYLFTSVTPKPFFEFPYPVALYVAAQPFWRFFPSELDIAFLLRGIALCADALVGFSLYALVRRALAAPGAALLAALLWTAAPASLQALSNANLTNAFGQNVFSVAMAGVGLFAAGASAVLTVPSTGAALTVAFLSHWGTVLLGGAILGATGVALVAAGRERARLAGLIVLLLALAAAAASWAVYYRHFGPVLQRTISRLSSGEREAATTAKMVAPPSLKLRRWFDGTGDDYGRPGLPLLATALAGGVLLARRRPRDGATLVLFAWGAAWTALTVIGFFTPLVLRVSLAAAPVFIVLAAFALVEAGSRARWAAALATALALVIAWDGLAICLRSLGVI